MKEFISRVSIIAIGVNKYNDPFLPRLQGAHKDVEKIKNILVKNKKTALYKPQQFLDLRDPNSTLVKQTINQYVLDRSADGDILIFYFSGHGVAIGRDDFGFCTTDTVIHPRSKTALPFSVVKFSEVMQSLNAANVIPVFILDACYSGIAGKTLSIPPIEAISMIQNQTHTLAASSYALLCSCSELEATLDSPDGGIFSNQLFKTLLDGLDKSESNESMLSLHDIFNKLSENVLRNAIDLTPRMYLGHTLPKFPFSLNTKYKVKTLTLSPFYVSILRALWNDGRERELTPDEISTFCGKGAYGNHSKLRLEPWQLVETVPNSKKHRLTKRGKAFMQNKLKIPLKIFQDQKTREWAPLTKSKQVDHSFFPKVIK